MPKSAKQQLEEYAAILRAQRRLEQRLEDIKWKHDVFLPALEAVKLEELPASTFDVEIIDEDSADS